MNNTIMPAMQVAIIGAGPAGLTAAYRLLKDSDQAVDVTLIEADPEYVGGISRTARYKGFHFDIGGHRFFSKSQEIEDMWTEILPRDMLDRPRSSRIFYNGKFFSYPLKAVEALLKLGVFESTFCMLSYAKSRAFPIKRPRNFEDWVSNQFGRRLFSIFFKTYTEKVWGMNCKEISADWAAQRIKGLSLWTAVKNALMPKRAVRNKAGVVKSLIDSFRYPRKGPGMMWEVCREKIEQLGGTIYMGSKVTECHWDEHLGLWSITSKGKDGEIKTFAHHLISSAPLRELVHSLTPELPESVQKAASGLRYRDFLTVMLILKDRNLFSDNWIYIHDPEVKVGRIQNFKSWSPEMVPDQSFCCYGLEYFCFEGDGLWNSTDEELINLAKQELEKIGLAAASDVLDGCVVRQPKAYPVYDDGYSEAVNRIRVSMEEQFPTLHLVGRNGMHKYNNQDHAMMTAILCSKNILAGEKIYDVWNVNQDAEYHEESKEQQSGSSGLRAVPERVEEVEPVSSGIYRK